MASLVVVGLQWGDEGKGKVVDILAGFADLVVRFQGGANAGHTLKVEGEEVVTHLVPSGVLHPGKRCAIGPAVVLDPEQLLLEVDVLQAKGRLSEPDSLMVSNRAHVVMPYHKQLDGAREQASGSAKIGTTLRGIGPCLEDKMSRSGIRVCDLMDSDLLTERVTSRLAEVNALLAHYGSDAVKADELLHLLRAQADRLRPFIGDVGELVRTELSRGRPVLFEGAQGVMLDVDHGTYPFVTSSNTVAGAVCAGLGLAPGRLSSVMGVAKAYSTRVGEGPFPTEMGDERGIRLQKAGGEVGATTGRPRRCGWLDLAALRYAVSVGGCTSLCLTKLDVLSGLGPLKVAVAYELDGERIESMPADAMLYRRIKPVYEELEGWDETLGEVRELSDLPAPVRRYLDFVSNFVNVPVAMVSVGPSRSETIMVQNPFRNR
ncbi:MAG: adenylosuccinate synthase [Deltaproteobacteria bacterium]|nr:adenylosuccinate synthase [Deltaproteobacteria bacterium]